MSHEMQINNNSAPVESPIQMEMVISVEGYHVGIVMNEIPDDETFDYLLQRMAYAKRYLHNAYFMDIPVNGDPSAEEPPGET